MAAKPKLWYFHGRGRMESIRWLLAAAGVEVGSRLQNGSGAGNLGETEVVLFTFQKSGWCLSICIHSFPFQLPSRGEGGLIVFCLNRSRKGEA